MKQGKSDEIYKKKVRKLGTSINLVKDLNLSVDKGKNKTRGSPVSEQKKLFFKRFCDDLEKGRLYLLQQKKRSHLPLKLSQSHRLLILRTPSLSLGMIRLWPKTIRKLQRPFSLKRDMLLILT